MSSPHFDLMGMAFWKWVWVLMMLITGHPCRYTRSMSTSWLKLILSGGKDSLNRNGFGKYFLHVWYASVRSFIVFHICSTASHCLNFFITQYSLSVAGTLNAGLVRLSLPRGSMFPHYPTLGTCGRIYCTLEAANSRRIDLRTVCQHSVPVHNCEGLQFQPETVCQPSQYELAHRYVVPPV